MLVSHLRIILNAIFFYTNLNIKIMAITPTVKNPLVHLQENIDAAPSLNRDELRHGSFGFVKHVQNDANKNTLVNEAELERELNLRKGSLPAKIPVLNKGMTGVNGGRISGNIPATSATSAYATGTSTILQSHFTIRPAENFTNYISYQKQFQASLKEVQKNMLLQAETFLKGVVDANLSQADNSGAYPIVGNVFQVPNSAEKTVLNKLKAIYLANKYADTLGMSVISNPFYQSVIADVLQYGTANEKNEILSLTGKSFDFSDQIAPAVGHEIYTLLPSSIASVNYNEPDATLHNDANNGRAKGTVLLPLLGMEVGVFTEKDFVATGTTNTLVESYSFSTDFWAIVSYLSTPATDPRNIYKFAIA